MITFIITAISIMPFSITAEHCRGECHLSSVSLVLRVKYEHLMLSVIMLSVIMLSVIMLSVIILNVVMLSGKTFYHFYYRSYLAEMSLK
jgi:dolichol kinase